MKYYCIVDKIALSCGPVFGAKNDDVAKRKVIDLLTQNAVKSPSEYSLISICKFDEDLIDTGIAIDCSEQLVNQIRKPNMDLSVVTFNLSDLVSSVSKQDVIDITPSDKE